VRRFEKGLDKDAVSPILFKLHSEDLNKEAREGFGDFNVGKSILTAKYGGYIVPLAKKETALQGMIDTLIEFGRSHGMEMNVHKTKVMRISRHPSLVETIRDQKQLYNMEYYNIWVA
jgi:hypothetical protein